MIITIDNSEKFTKALKNIPLVGFKQPPLDVMLIVLQVRPLNQPGRDFTQRWDFWLVIFLRLRVIESLFKAYKETEVTHKI